MPSLRKLSEAEIAALEQPRIGARAQVAREYDEYLADFALGEYGRAELIDGEQRNTVRRRLHAAARRRGLALRFRPGPGPLTFRVEAVPIVETVPAVDAALAAAPAAPPLRPSHRRETPAERYREVLPRWMREGQPPGRREGSNRRAR